MHPILDPIENGATYMLKDRYVCKYLAKLGPLWIIWIALGILFAISQAVHSCSRNTAWSGNAKFSLFIINRAFMSRPHCMYRAYLNLHLCLLSEATSELL